MACDANTLMDNAKCIDATIPKGMQMAVLVYLMCLIQQNGGTGGGGVTQIEAGTGIEVSPPAGTGAVTVQTPTFVSPLLTLNQNQWIENHGLGQTPPFVRAVFVCIADDVFSGISAGQEMDATSLYDAATQSTVGIYADATQIIISTVTVPLGEEGNFNLASPAGGNGSIGSFDNFRLKIYARL